MIVEQKYKDIIVKGFEAEQSDNAIKKAIFNAGCDFNDVNKTFNATVKESKLRMSPKERTVKTAEFLEHYDPSTVTYEDHLTKISALQEYLGCRNTQAGASMRKWAKDNGLTLPKPPETPKVAGFRGKQKIVTDWYLENSDATFEQLLKFTESNVAKTKTGKDNRREYVITAWNAKIFADQLYSVEPVEEVEELA